MYPVNLVITGKLCVVIGGGDVAGRKARGLLEAGARVRVISPRLNEELAALVERGEVEWVARAYQTGDLCGALLVFAATDDPGVQQLIAREAARAGQLLNVVDDPQGCTFQVPAVARRGDLLLTVSTCGRSPAMAAMIRRRLEEEFGDEYLVLLELLSMLRPQIIAKGGSHRQKKALFQQILHPDMPDWIKNGCWDELRRHLRVVLGAAVDLDFSSLTRKP